MEKREKSDIISSINDNKDSRVKNEAFPLNVEHPCIAEMAYIQSERYLRHLNLRCRIPDPVPAGNEGRRARGEGEGEGEGESGEGGMANNYRYV